MNVPRAVLGVLVIFLGMYWDQLQDFVLRGNVPLPREMPWGLLFDEEQLRLHDGQHWGHPTYLACMGSVFDVSTGLRFYGPGQEYAHFAGQDASIAFWTGALAPEGTRSDDTRGLALEAVNGIMHWYEFYKDHEMYNYVGRVVGSFYNERGETKEEYTRLAGMRAMHWVREGLKEHDESDQKRCSGSWSAARQAVKSTCGHWNAKKSPGEADRRPRYKWKWWEHLPAATRSSVIGDATPPGPESPLDTHQYYCVCLSPNEEDAYGEAQPHHVRGIPDCGVEDTHCWVPRENNPDPGREQILTAERTKTEAEQLQEE
jgi:predicted heme/steroid binding protein